ncbi:MAG: radical SAM protein [Candidatus Nitrosopumilus sp. bin_6a]
MEPLKIYLGDLTYNTIAVSTESLPINIGFIASYCLKQFGDKVDITLFKYIDDLEKALSESPPAILGLSNYCWCQNVSQEMFKLFTEKNPNGLRIWGGPNFPIDAPSQKKFFKRFENFDIYVPIDGEVGFSNVVERVLERNSENIRENVLGSPLDGCIIKNSEGKLLYSLADTRLKNLDEIPSPYLTGLVDKFFDDNLIPMLQTNRGCPFSCTFCTDGREAVNMVNRFSKQRTSDEINYIATHVKKNVHSMFISDLNFGMIPGDIETCEAIKNVQEKYNYPHKLLTTTGKNNKKKIIESIKSLSGSLSLSMSVQSMDDQVLKNIKRDNISKEVMLDLAPVIKENNMNTTAEVILGLPGETYKSHLETIRKLISAKLDDVITYTCFLLPGSEMATPEQQMKWKFKTKFRMLPMDFAKLSSGKKICEIEEVIVGSKDLSFDDYVQLRMIGFTLWMTNKGILYTSIIKFLRQQNIDVADLFFQMVERQKTAPEAIQKVYAKFKQATIDELHDSPEEILTKIQDDDEFQKLVDEKAAINVIRFHHTMILSEYMDEWTKYVLKIAHDLLEEKNKLNNEIEKQFHDVSNYCLGKSHNPLGKDRMTTNPEYVFNYDIEKWLDDKLEILSLDEFRVDEPFKLIFNLTDEQFNIIKDNLELFGDSTVGYTKALKMVPERMFWRNPMLLNKND